MAEVPESLVKLANRVSARTAQRISAVALALELAIALTTFLPDAPLLPKDLPFLLFPGIFVVHFRSVVLLAGSPRQSPWALLRRVPWPATAAFVALFFGCWWLAGSAIASSRGESTERQGHFFLNDHGDYIPVTHAEYLHAVALQQRGFALIAAVFYALGVLVNFGARKETDDPKAKSYVL